MNLKAVLEGILFIVGDEGTTIKDMVKVLQISEDEVKTLLLELKKDYENDARGLRISYLGNAFKLTTKIEHKEYYERMVIDSKTTTLSNAALEVLAVIAYNEPITRLEVDEIRGVNSSQIIRRLLARGFIRVCGKSDNIGKPNLYKTTNDFLDYFGLSSKEDLPELMVESKEDSEAGDLYQTTYKDNN